MRSKDRLVTLDIDREFRDFNLCAFHEPGLSPLSPLPESELFRRASEIRKGDCGTAGEFAEALQRTLRKETFEAFQKYHGPRPIQYADWFYAKSDQSWSDYFETRSLSGSLSKTGLDGASPGQLSENQYAREKKRQD